MNFRMIRHIIGWLLLFECVFLAVPALTAVVYRERVVVYYLGTMALCGLLGWLCIRRKPPVTALYAREGFVIVAMSWILLSLMGALPLWRVRLYHHGSLHPAGSGTAVSRRADLA